VTTPAPSSRQRWLVPVVVVVLSVTVGAGLLARELYRRPDQPADDAAVSTAASSSAGSGTAAASDAVRMTPDAGAHPQAETVRTVLKTYFDAINTKDYQKWTSVVSAERVAQQPPDRWRLGVRSTKDSDALVYRIERGAGTSLRVLIAFRSVQDPQDAPSFFREGCIKWRLVMPMVVEKALKIDTVEPGPQPEIEKC
jgi:hypothetical protein